MMHDCLLSLGSNQGDREKNLSTALHYIQKILSDIHLSSVYESQALLAHDAPQEWNKPYLNLSVYGQYFGDADSLLELLQGIENKIGRSPTALKWAPRVIDIDILLFADLIIKHTQLTIPHPEMLNRFFVILPSAEIAGHLIHPITQNSLHKELNNMHQRGINTLDIKKYHYIVERFRSEY